jgi:hypothetical protein
MKSVGSRDLDHTIITWPKRVGSITGLADQLAFEDVNAFLKRVDMCLDDPTGLKLTNAEFLMNGAHLTTDDTPATITFAQLFKRFWHFEICLFRCTDDMSCGH